MRLFNRYFKLLSEAEKDILIESVKNNTEVKMCEVCEGVLFERECERCPFRERLAKDMLIENFIPLVLKIAGRYAYGDYKQELISVGLLALTDAVSRLEKLEYITNLKGYITNYIHYSIRNYVITDSVIKVPAYATKNTIRLKRIEIHLEDAPVPAQQAQVDVEETVRKICKTKYDTIIMKRLAQGGYTNSEIAAECGVSAPYISQLKLKLKSDLKKELL